MAICEIVLVDSKSLFLLNFSLVILKRKSGVLLKLERY